MVDCSRTGSMELKQDTQPGILYESPLLSLSLCLQHEPLKGKGSPGRKIQGRDKEDTEGLYKYKYNY